MEYDYLTWLTVSSLHLVFFYPLTLTPYPGILPDDPRCVPEDGGGEALGDAHKTGPIHLHDLVIHLDPDGHTGERTVQQSFVQVFPSLTCDLPEHSNITETCAAKQQQEATRHKTNWLIMHSTLSSKLQRSQTLLQSQISSSALPDCCLMKRQRRWGSKQNRRANQDTTFPGQQHCRNSLLCGWDDRSAKFSTRNETPDGLLLMTGELCTNPSCWVSAEKTVWWSLSLCFESFLWSYPSIRNHSGFYCGAPAWIWWW